MDYGAKKSILSPSPEATGTELKVQQIEAERRNCYPRGDDPPTGAAGLA
jgi:hypothetical protein